MLDPQVGGTPAAQNRGGTTTTQGNTPLNNILTNATHTNTTGTGVQNFQSGGGMNAAMTDFSALNPTNVRMAPNGTIVGRLPDGRTVNIHPGHSVGGAPTLEIFDPNTRIRIKIRY